MPLKSQFRLEFSSFRQLAVINLKVKMQGKDVVLPQSAEATKVVLLGIAPAFTS